jgi:archaellum component FlaC
MENPDTNSSYEITRSPEEVERLVEELEEKIKRHERIINDFNIVGPNMSGNVDEGFEYGPSTDVSA